MLYLRLAVALLFLCGRRRRRRSQCICVSSACRQWYKHEQETDLCERAGSARSPGLAVQEEREQRLPGYEMEEVLVCAEEDVSLLVHQSAGELNNSFIDSFMMCICSAAVTSHHVSLQLQLHKTLKGPFVRISFIESVQKSTKRINRM